MILADKPAKPVEDYRTNRIAVAVLLAICTFAAGSIVALLASQMAVEQANDTTKAKLRSEIDVRKNRVIEYLEDVESNLVSIASSRIAAGITEDFVNALELDADLDYSRMRSAYLANNPNPPGKRQALLYANDGSNYSRVHARYHDWLLSISTAHDYYDLFLTDAEGNIVYSVFKEDDFGTSLIDGDYRDTALATIFKRVKETPNVERTTFSNFEAYGPSNDLPAAFVGSPVIHDGQFVGAFMVQLKHSRLNNLINTDASVSGDIRAYLAGTDGILRAGSGFASDKVLLASYDQPSAKAAFENRSGVLETTGFQGNDVMLAYAPLRWKNEMWALVVEIDRGTYFLPVEKLHRTMILAVLLSSLVAFVLGWLLAVRPEDSFDVRTHPV